MGPSSATHPTHLIHPSWASTQVPASGFLSSGETEARVLLSNAEARPHVGWRLAQGFSEGPHPLERGLQRSRMARRGLVRSRFCQGPPDGSCPRRPRWAGARDLQRAWFCPLGRAPMFTADLGSFCTLDFR